MRGWQQNDRDSRRLTIHDTVSRANRELQPPLSFFIEPRWAPDQRLILIRGTDLHDREGIFQVDIATGQMSVAVAFPSQSVQSARTSGRQTDRQSGTTSAARSSRMTSSLVAKSRSSIMRASRFCGCSSGPGSVCRRTGDGLPTRGSRSPTTSAGRSSKHVRSAEHRSSSPAPSNQSVSRHRTGRQTAGSPPHQTPCQRGNHDGV